MSGCADEDRYTPTVAVENGFPEDQGFEHSVRLGVLDDARVVVAQRGEEDDAGDVFET